jgi:long-chain acyl-CoA synthetase
MKHNTGMTNLEQNYLLPNPVYIENIKHQIDPSLSDEERIILYWAKKCRPVSFIQNQLRIDGSTITHMIEKLGERAILKIMHLNTERARERYYRAFHGYKEAPGSLNLQYLWQSSAASFAHNTYILDRNDNTSYTYSEFDKIIKYTTSTLIQYNITKSDKIILHADINFEAIALFWSCAQLGVIFIPVNSLWAEPVITGLIEKLNPKLIFLSRDVEFCKRWPEKVVFFDEETNVPDKLYFSEWLKESQEIENLPEINENDLAVILHTSGSTGEPKGVKLAHGQLFACAQKMVKAYLWTQKDNNISTNDLDSIAGFRNATVATVLAGATCIIPTIGERNSPAELLSCIYETDTTCMITGPSLLNQLMAKKDAKTKLEKIRCIISSGSALTTHLKTEFFEKTNKRISNLFGMTETAGLAVCEPLDSTNPNGNYIGFPVDCIVKIVDHNNNNVKVGEIGELLLYGSTVFKGYYSAGEPNANEVQQWLVTGDLAKMNPDGSIELTGRKKDFMKNAYGEIVYFSEIESALMKLSFIKDLGIIAFFQNESERAALFIEINVNAQLPKNPVEEVKKELTKTIGSNKIPAAIKFIEKIPRNTFGKLLRAELNQYL